jgi:hypothetical protein
MLPAALLTVVVIWLAGVAGVAEGGGSSTRHPTAPAVYRAPTRASSALVLLRDWDRRRAAAWASGDPTALARLYVAGSRTGVRDRLDLRRWVGRGLRVTGLRQQVRSLRVLAWSHDRLVVVVTDRTVGGVAVASTRRTALPASGWATHRITLRRSGPAWRVVEVRGQPAR